MWTYVVLLCGAARASAVHVCMCACVKVCIKVEVILPGAYL